jgi:hypothetical protein
MTSSYRQLLSLFSSYNLIDDDNSDMLPPIPRSTPTTTPVSPLSAPTIADPTAILAILRSADAVATLVCNEIGNALDPEHEDSVQQALKDLRKGVENLKSDIMIYKALLSPMEKDPELLMQRYVMAKAHMLTEPIIHNITDWKERKE